MFCSELRPQIYVNIVTMSSWLLLMILMVLVHGIIVELCGILWNYFFPGSIIYRDQIQDPAHVFG